MNRLEVCEFISRNKHLVGFGEYEVKVEFKNNNSDCHAEIIISEVGQQLDITFFKDFQNMSDNKQTNIKLMVNAITNLTERWS